MRVEIDDKSGFCFGVVRAIDKAERALAGLSLGRGQRCAPVVYGRVWWLRAGLAAAVLLAGVCADHALSPVLLRLALERVLS